MIGRNIVVMLDYSSSTGIKQPVVQASKLLCIYYHCCLACNKDSGTVTPLSVTLNVLLTRRPTCLCSVMQACTKHIIVFATCRQLAVFLFGFLHCLLSNLQQTPEGKPQHLPGYSRPGEHVLKLNYRRNRRANIAAD